MCGLLAHISLSGEPVDHDRFEKAVLLQRHRGPDDSGIYSSGDITLGHRRLSIIDLDHASAQPMHSLDGNVSIVYNGEIYNYLELKEGLENRGHEFVTRGDTEVLIALYLEYGIAFLERLIGMYAFVLHDSRTGEVFAARDRLGVKPLYYYQDDNSLVFSSEIKSILYLKPSPSQLNPEAISSYFSFRYPILDDTFYCDIFSVPPGQYFRIDGGRLEKKRYWDLAAMVAKQKVDRGEDYYIQRTLELLRSSVKYRQIADVKVGAYLSGGVDSSAVVALMTESTRNCVQTFTIGFQEEGYDEFPQARRVADRYETDHHEIVLSGEDYLKTLNKLILLKDAPLSVPNEVPLYLMSKELKKFITVVLSGEGADEIFGGYGRIFRSAFEYEKLVKINACQDRSPQARQFLGKIEKKYGRTRFQDELDHFLAIYSYTSEELKSRFLTPVSHNEEISDKLRKKIAFCFSELCGESYLNKMMYTFEKIHLPGLLQRLDMTTMATSVEARVPFTDHRLVEFAFTIPTKYKLKWSSESVNEDNFLLSEEVSEVHDIPKYVLKRSLVNHLDDTTLYRKKMGFPVPLEKWFGGKFNEYALQILSTLDISEFVNVQAVSDVLKGNELSSNHPLAMKIWMVINLALFIKSHQKEFAGT